ncbi:calcipressin-2-like [Liolophura sinensis]|uniref:calcipressin-2-like n=1 Tax=Liolophura sinensis TaxID=3198878 RepID=UPI003158FF90
MADTPDNGSQGQDEVNDVIQIVNEDNGFHCDINEEETHDLPKSLIVTNVADEVYESDEVKAEFEATFRQYHPDATFNYLKSFRRARVNYTSAAVATRARIHFNENQICGKTVKCYFVQPKSEQMSNTGPNLMPPAPEKQFLISPPASPPVGWEPVPEASPIVNYDLIAALSKLTPGETHELHPQSSNQPGIVVHLCEEQDPSVCPRPTIVQTRCPDRS